MQVRDLDDRGQRLASILAAAMGGGQLLAEMHRPGSRGSQPSIARAGSAGDAGLQRGPREVVDLRAHTPVEEDGSRPECDGSSCCSGLQQPPTRQRDHVGTVTRAPPAAASSACFIVLRVDSTAASALVKIGSSRFEASLRCALVALRFSKVSVRVLMFSLLKSSLFRFEVSFWI